MKFRLHGAWLWVVLGCCFGLTASTLRAATPAVELTATNVSMGDRGSATSTLTLTSLNGFTGQVFLSCGNGEEDIDPNGAVLPICTVSPRILTVPANGSVSGTAQFTPPPTVSTSLRPELPGRPKRGPLGAPLTACCLASLTIIGLRMKRGRSRVIAFMLLAAAGLAGLGSMTACIGKGGLAMTPGTYFYEIQADSQTGVSETTSEVKVTIHE